MAKPGGTGQSATVRNMQKTQNRGDILSIFHLLILVNFDLFTIHILRNCDEKNGINIFLKKFQTGSYSRSQPVFTFFSFTSF